MFLRKESATMYKEITNGIYTFYTSIIRPKRGVHVAPIAQLGER
jgi:hypothetical protein